MMVIYIKRLQLIVLIKVFNILISFVRLFEVEIRFGMSTSTHMRIGVFVCVCLDLNRIQSTNEC